MTVLYKIEACPERAECIAELQRVPQKIKIFNSQGEDAENNHYRELFEQAL
jgi:hypothetical protein